MRRSLFVLAGLLGLAALALGVLTPAEAQEGAKWGTVKGQVVWAGGKVPARAEEKVTTDKDHCLSKGPILSEQFVIDKNTGGVKWVVVWLRPLDTKDAKATLPVHPDLAKVPVPASATMDQPCCMFEPHVLAMRAGQKLVVKNSAPVSHNVHLTSIATTGNPNDNKVVAPGKDLTVEGWKAHTTPTSVKCDIHPWMQAWIRVFDHPYYAVTDDKGNFEIKNAPAGEYRIVVWHESGYLVADKGKDPSKDGRAITIKAGDPTDLGKIELKPE